MTYIVTQRNDIEGLDWLKKISVKESLDIMKDWPVVQFDTETSGLDPRLCYLHSLQFGYKNFKTGSLDQIVVDCHSVKPEEYKGFIESHLLVGHNLKFDLQFLFNHNIVPRKLYDTMICEQVLYLGYKPNMISYNLHDVAKRRLGIELDKSYQKLISKKGLTIEGIRYAAKDVMYLQDIRKIQFETARARNCVNALNLENAFVPAIAYLEWCGIHLDEEKWKEKMQKDEEQRLKYKNELDKYVITHTKLNNKFVSSVTQGSLFAPENESFSADVIINWDSPSQTVDLFKELGFSTTIIDKKSHKERDSVLENTLKSQKGIADDFLDIYFKYREATKRVTSFGQKHLNLINPKTGRLHTSFKQIGTITGRMSSGSKSPNYDLAKEKKLLPKDVPFCNMQQLPHDAETRACFTAEPGNVFVSCDYSAEESRVQADVWNEKSLLDSFEKGIDTHNLYAKMCFPDELKNIDVRDVKKKRPDLRQAAKSAEFAVGYGSDGSAIAKNIGMSVEKSRAMVQGILKGMPGMAAFKKKMGKFLEENGYIPICEKTGHRIYWPEWSTWKAEKDRFSREFWDNYAIYHKGTNDSTAQMVKRHMLQRTEWLERKVLNAPIQGGSAIVLKQAASDLFNWIVDHGYFNKILFCVFAHDEIDCECPKGISDSFSKIMEKIMERAAGIYYKKLKIPAECTVASYWVH